MFWVFFVFNDIGMFVTAISVLVVARNGQNGSGVSSNTLTDYLHDFEELHFSISSDAHLKIVRLQS